MYNNHNLTGFLDLTNSTGFQKSGKVNNELRVARYEFGYTSYEFKSTSYEFKPASYEFKSTSYEF